MAFVGLLVLAWVRQGTFVDFALLGADDEWEVVEFVEVEA